MIFFKTETGVSPTHWRDKKYIALVKPSRDIVNSDFITKQDNQSATYNFVIDMVQPLWMFSMFECFL